MADNADLLHDHTLVWMTHPDVDVAAQYPRSFLTLDSGWKELSDPDRSPKVQKALSGTALVRPAAETIKEK
jgi:hypothetical protein